MRKLYEISVIITMRIVYFIFPKFHDSYGFASLLIPLSVSANLILLYILHIQKLILSDMRYKISIIVIFGCFSFATYLAFFLTKRDDLEELCKDKKYKIASKYRILYVGFMLLSFYSLYKFFNLPAPLLDR